MADESTAEPARNKLPPNVKLLGAASLINDIASEMIFPLMPAFLMGVLGGNKVDLGIMEGLADSVSSLLKLWSGAWSDRAGWRKGFVVVGYALAALSRPLSGLALCHGIWWPRGLPTASAKEFALRRATR